MENRHKYISASYQLYSVADGKRELEEQTSEDRPFEFITGFGIALDALEQQLSALEAGSDFDFTLEPAQAFGEYNPEGVNKLSREAFTVDGKFDGAHIYPGAIIHLVDAEQNQFMARVLEVGDNDVTLDANHPLAGKTLNFTGRVKENREATEAEIQQLIRQLTGGCGGCGGNCGEGGCGNEGCDCGKN